MPNVATSLLCPFCRQANQCSVNAPAGCWCITQTIPPELLNLLPATVQGKDCICAQCVQAFKQDPNVFKARFISDLQTTAQPTNLC